MDILFLGYQIHDFVNENGEPVKGVKFFFAYHSEKRNYHGMETASYFADYDRDKLLYDMVQRCKPMTMYNAVLLPSFSGKTKIQSIGEIKS